MARPREFDETTVLDAVMGSFWHRGYDATSIRDLVDETGLTTASLYNAFGDKRALFQQALERYVEMSIANRIRRCSDLPGREAIEAFFAEIVSRSMEDADRKGCMLVNAATSTPTHDAEQRQMIDGVLRSIEAFFQSSIERGRRDGSVTSSVASEPAARHLLAVLMGVRVLARARPEEGLLKDIVSSATALLIAPRS